MISNWSELHWGTALDGYAALAPALDAKGSAENVWLFAWAEGTPRRGSASLEFSRRAAVDGVNRSISTATDDILTRKIHLSRVGADGRFVSDKVVRTLRRDEDLARLELTARPGGYVLDGRDGRGKAQPSAPLPEPPVFRAPADQNLAALEFDAKAGEGVAVVTESDEALVYRFDGRGALLGPPVPLAGGAPRTIEQLRRIGTRWVAYVDTPRPGDRDARRRGRPLTPIPLPRDSASDVEESRAVTEGPGGAVEIWSIMFRPTQSFPFHVKYLRVVSIDPLRGGPPSVREVDGLIVPETATARLDTISAVDRLGGGACVLHGTRLKNGAPEADERWGEQEAAEVRLAPDGRWGAPTPAHPPDGPLDVRGWPETEPEPHAVTTTDARHRIVVVWREGNDHTPRTLALRGQRWVDIRGASSSGAASPAASALAGPTGGGDRPGPRR